MIKAWKIKWNKKSASKLGWRPEWFCTTDFDDFLLSNIKAFQREHGLKEDGLCGSETYRIIVTEREAAALIETPTTKQYIICGGVEIPIQWDKVSYNWLPTDTYRKGKRGRMPVMNVLHWDVALSAKSAHKIFVKRKFSTHFVIDNDGTIVQMVDTQHIAFHAGKVNKFTVGIDFSNAYYMKYQNWYRKKGFGNRPVLSFSEVHGRRLGEHLGFYNVQEEALKALLKALNSYYGIPFECPMKDEKLITTVFKPALKKKFKGTVNHYNLTKKKIDCAGLELDKLLREIRNVN